MLLPDLPIAETAADFIAGKHGQRIGLPADDEHIQQREAAQNHHQRSRNHTPGFAQAWMEDQQQRQDISEHTITPPEQLRVNATIGQNEALETGLMREIQVGHVISHDQIQSAYDENTQQVLLAPQDGRIEYLVVPRINGGLPDEKYGQPPCK